jgi:hypothetical protein
MHFRLELAGKIMSCVLISNDFKRIHQPQLLSVCIQSQYGGFNIVLTPEASKKYCPSPPKKWKNDLDQLLARR